MEERKLKILADYKQYMEDKPELRQVLNDFTCAVLTSKPKNIYKFARFWFSMSLPPLDAVSTAGSMANKDKALQPEVQTMAHIKRVATHRLLARIYATIDANQDTLCTKDEFLNSPFAKMWPAVVWDRMDVDSNGTVTPTEFFAFMRTVEADEGKAKFHETVAKFIEEGDINIMDLLPPADELKDKIKAVDKEKLQEYLFKAAIHTGAGEERDFIYRKEMQYSRIGQIVLPFWADLDADENGKVTLTEWKGFFQKAEESALGKELASSGESLIVDLFIDGGYDIADVLSS